MLTAQARFALDVTRLITPSQSIIDLNVLTQNIQIKINWRAPMRIWRRIARRGFKAIDVYFARYESHWNANFPKPTKFVPSRSFASRHVHEMG